MPHITTMSDLDMMDSYRIAQMAAESHGLTQTQVGQLTAIVFAMKKVWRAKDYGTVDTLSLSETELIYTLRLADDTVRSLISQALDYAQFARSSKQLKH